MTQRAGPQAKGVLGWLLQVRLSSEQGCVHQVLLKVKALWSQRTGVAIPVCRHLGRPSYLAASVSGQPRQPSLQTPLPSRSSVMLKHRAWLTCSSVHLDIYVLILYSNNPMKQELM